MKSTFYFFLLSLILSSCGKKQESIMPVKRELIQAVYASGKVLPVNDYKIFSKVPGYVSEIKVKVGDLVKKGDVLLIIRNDAGNYSKQSAENVAALNRRNASERSSLLSSLKADVDAAYSKYKLDSANYRRYENLLRENAVSKIVFEQSKTQEEISRQTYRKLMANYLATADRVRTEAENAGLQAEAQGATLDDFTIRAERDGKVYDIDARVGELVPMNRPVIEIGDEKVFEVELSVDEMDINLIQPNQEVSYTIDAFKDKIFKGKILESYPRISSGNKTSKVIASITSDEALYSGMSAEANIMISKKKDAVVIPRDYLVSGNKVILKGSQDTVKVKTGAEDLEYVEVLEGLQVNQELIRP